MPGACLYRRGDVPRRYDKRKGDKMRISSRLYRWLSDPRVARLATLALALGVILGTRMGPGSLHAGIVWGD